MIGGNPVVVQQGGGSKTQASVKVSAVYKYTIEYISEGTYTTWDSETPQSYQVGTNPAMVDVQSIMCVHVIDFNGFGVSIVTSKLEITGDITELPSNLRSGGEDGYHYFLVNGDGSITFS